MGKEAWEEKLDDFQDGKSGDDGSDNWNQIEGYVQQLHIISR